MRYLQSILFILIFVNTFSQDSSYQAKMGEYYDVIEKDSNTNNKIAIYKEIIKLSYPEHLDSILLYSETLLELSEKTNDNTSKAFANNFLGKYYFESEDFHKANDFYANALKFYNELNDTVQIALLNHDLGLVNQYLNNYDKALVYYQKAIELNELVGETLQSAVCYQCIGTLYSDLKKYSLAQYYYERALEIYQDMGNKERIAAIYQNIGVLNYNWGNLKESLEYYKKSLEVYEKLQDKRNIAVSLSNIGLVYEEYKRYNEAQEYYQKALIIFEEIDSKQMLVYIFYNLGSIKRNLKDYSKSIDYFKKGLALSMQISMKDYISYNYEALSGVYDELGDYMQALIYYKEYNYVKDSLFNEEKLRQIQLLEAEFQNAEHQKQIEYLKLDKELKESQLKKKEAQNLVLIFSSVSAFLIVIFLLLFTRYQKKISLKLYNEIEERKRTENQLNIVREELEIRVRERTADIVETNRKLLHEVEEHKKTLKSLEVAKNKAEEADRLKTNFLANISHEVRTPMNAITGFTQMLAYDNLTVAKRNNYINLIKEGCKSLTNLIDDIVDFANIESGEAQIEKKEFNPHPILEFLYDHFTIELVKRNKEHLALGYENENSENDLIINTDPVRLKQILSILIDNAIKFTKSGYIQFGFAHSGNDKIQFYVKDTGIGIEEKYSDLIFERFRQIDESTTKKYGGAGIGLSVAGNLTRLLNGKIWFESIIGVGSTFYFEINSKLEGAEIELIQPNQFNWENRVILIAEDKKINFEILKETLQETSIGIKWVKNGADAIDYIKSNPVDLILMDIQMPVMDGFETTRKIKEITDKIPIIAQTAYALPQDSYKCIDAGCNDYIAKPISLDKFLLKLNKYLS